MQFALSCRDAPVSLAYRDRHGRGRDPVHAAAAAYLTLSLKKIPARNGLVFPCREVWDYAFELAALRRAVSSMRDSSAKQRLAWRWCPFFWIEVAP